MSTSMRIQTPQTFLSSFATLSIPSFSAVLADSYKHNYAPASLVAELNRGGYDGKEAFLEHIRSVAKLMTGFPVTPLRMIQDEAENAVWAWCRSWAEWRESVVDGDAEWGYEGEYVFMFWMDGEGKIEKCVEMLDTWATREKLLVLSARARENIKRRTGEEFKWLERE
ncbi:uncharacterized protein CC84DRAFT_1177344 [Paraphaeosphaeria sporulosa]|uniref:SnoaL-like domain-containing protein n=1 Tax=Paraphaeosphaeria sporulosa TaxID=1460663 RepID=A0A177CDG2_9PLEO|nr:uncharacterized protein CC84DRAFT_1177344 [Paraphaeosphaeria sporulosa]OAG05271.1 hypothetical protein CC84DRAFT_1177344 [Paraphaeosphaeria sporulosa]